MEPIQWSRIGGEAGGDAVGRVGVEVEDRHLPGEAVGADRGDGHGDVVHRAVAAGRRRAGVVEAAEQVELGLAAAQRLAGGLDGGAGGETDRAHHLVDRDVGGVDAEDRGQGLRARHRLEQRRVVDAGQLGVGGAAGGAPPGTGDGLALARATRPRSRRGGCRARRTRGR